MGKWTPRHEAPEPLEGNVVATVTGGTFVWFGLFLVQLPFYGWLDANGHLWWLWTCLAGAFLGCIGIGYVRRRESAIQRATEAARAGGATGADGSKRTDGAEHAEGSAGTDGAGRAERAEPATGGTGPAGDPGGTGSPSEAPAA